MISIEAFPTIGTALFEAARTWPDQPFVAVPANPSRSYHPQGLAWTYREVEAAVRQLATRYQAAGYGQGRRIGLLLENRPEHILHKLAMNHLGITCVPINPDYRPREMAYVIDHTRMDLVVVLDALDPLLQQAMGETRHQPAVFRLEDADTAFPPAAQAATVFRAQPDTIASILYTSGTTGKPKGCMLSHRYELASGAWYAARGGLVALEEGCERLYNPLPLFHINASVLSLFCCMLKGNCQIQPDRFQASRWFTEVSESRATVVHFLGVMVPILLNQTAHALELQHQIKFGLGAGIDPQRHAEFEARFGYPLIEVWGMTESVRLVIDADTPRKVGTRAFGRVQPGMEIQVVDDNDQPVPDGVPGELRVRHSAATPRRDCFSGYLNDPDATQAAWHGGWLRTGDVVVRDPDGLFYFMERRKNIVRRSGENIAAAEVEAVLQSHPAVAQAAVLAVPDEVREEEVLACVVLKGERPKPLGPDDALVQELLEYCNEQMTYFKVPGWLWFPDAIPITSTQKIQKHRIFATGADPRTTPGMIDVRVQKKRSKA
ncbi:AMP-binding protein [Comamonas sp. A7-5]|uniref:AMP-binding protein n=1 Tax=Comamonas sp. A7-5 TaxID=673549 RepID=UPI0031D357C4